MKILVTMLLTCTLWVLPGLAFAQTAPTPEPPQRVAVSPFVYLPSTLPIAPESARAAIVDGMQAWTEASPDFWLYSTAQLADGVTSVPGYEDAVALAKLQKSLGIESYAELDLPGARSKLEQARKQYARIGQQFVDPDEVSEAMLYEALALLDDPEGSPSEPLELMKSMLLLNPAQTVQAGAFPDEVVAFYRSARSDLERDVREGGPSEQVPRQVAAVDVGSDGRSRSKFVLVGNVLPTDTPALEVVVWLYDVESEQFTLDASMIVAAPTAQNLREAASRLTSQLLTCLVPPDPVDTTPLESSRGQNPLALQLNMVYGAFLRFPEVAGQSVEPIGNLGSSIGASFHVTREFAVVAAFQFLNSWSEYSNLVQPGFRTLRAFAGTELGYTFGRLRVAVGTLAEGTAVSNITTCPGDDVVSRRFCDPAEELNTQFLFGVNARPRVSFSIIDSLQVFVGGSTSFYLFPLGEDSLNFLTNAEAGAQYRF